MTRKSFINNFINWIFVNWHKKNLLIICCRGVYVSKEGSQYEGDWQSNMRHGECDTLLFVLLSLSRTHWHALSLSLSLAHTDTPSHTFTLTHSLILTHTQSLTLSFPLYLYVSLCHYSCTGIGTAVDSDGSIYHGEFHYNMRHGKYCLDRTGRSIFSHFTVDLLLPWDYIFTFQ